MQSADCSRCDKFWSRSPESGKKFNKMRPANVFFVWKPQTPWPKESQPVYFMLCNVILFYFAFYFSLLQRKKIDSPLLQQCLYIFSSFYYVDLCHISCDFNLHHNFIVTGLQLDDVIVVDLVSDPIPGWLANLDDWAITTCVHDLKADWFGLVRKR